MRDNVNIPGTPLAEIAYITDGCGHGAFHGQERPDYEAGKIYCWDAHRMMWVYNRELRMLGFSIPGVWLDEAVQNAPARGSETPGAQDGSQHGQRAHLG